MNIAKIILALLAIGALALVPTIATAQTFIFDVPSGDWETPGNWNPSGTPAAGDIVAIGSGKTCRIETADQAAFKIRVDGQLIIKGKTLSMLHDGGVSPEMEVNGIVQFEKPGATTPKIEFSTTGTEATFLIHSTNNAGKVTADGASGHEGVIDALSTDTLTVESGVLIRGSIAVDCSILINKGTFLVSDDDDTMYIGATDTGFGTSGTGTFEVSAGKMLIRRLKPANLFTGTMKVSGGTMTLTEHVVGSVETDAKVEVSGGILLFESDWLSSGGLDFTGGTIKVVEDETATFE